MRKNDFEPLILAFLCNWCSYAGADLAGTSRIQYPPNIKAIRVMCSGRVDPTFILKAFAIGVDGVFVGGCHPGDCHYMKGNLVTRRKIVGLKAILDALGIDNRRLRLEWVSASEGARFAQTVSDFTKTVKELGALKDSQPVGEDL